MRPLRPLRLASDGIRVARRSVVGFWGHGWLANRRASGRRRLLPGGLGLRNELIAPPPKDSRADDGDQNHTDDRQPDGPTNSEFRDEDKNDQQNCAADDEDGCGRHG